MSMKYALVVIMCGDGVGSGGDKQSMGMHICLCLQYNNMLCWWLMFVFFFFCISLYTI